MVLFSYSNLKSIKSIKKSIKNIKKSIFKTKIY